LSTLAIGLALVCACTPKSPAINLQPVELPDLTRMAPSAQKQIRERHAALIALAQNAATPTFDLSNAYGEMGKLLMAAQYGDAAERCFLNAQTLNTSDYRWPYYLAQLYRSRGDAQQSLTFFQRTLQLQPDDVATLVWLGDTNLALGRPDVAEPQFQKALTLQSSSVSARYGLGRAALARNDTPRAITLLEEVLARDPTAASAHYPLSLAYAAVGDQAKADEHLRLRANREILPADPLMVALEGLVESPQSYETQGIRALDRKDWAGAAEQFRKGLALDPDSPALHHRLGTSLSMQGDRVGAEHEFQEAVRLSPDYFLAQYSLGVLLQADGKHGEAIERFSAALRARPIYIEARLRLASSLRRTGRVADALSEYQQVLTSNADVTEARLGAAMALAQLGRYRQALDRLSAAAQVGPDRIVFSHAVARLLATAPDDRVRDGAKALALVQDLVQQGRTVELGETMAMALAEMGEFERAASVQRDLLVGARRNGLTAVAPRIAANLTRYEQRQPCRTPWTLEEMP